MAKNWVNWFEIPVSDIERARKFYEAVFKTELQMTEMEGWKMAIFPGDGEKGVHGALIHGDTYTPSDKGSLVYFNGGDDLSEPLSRVESAGGKVIRDKFSIGEHGFIALAMDCEGNRIALHSMK